MSFSKTRGNNDYRICFQFCLQLISCFLSCLKNKLLMRFPISGHNFFFVFSLILKNLQAFMQRGVNLNVN